MAQNGTTDPLVGDVLGNRYEIVRKLARGGMATIYRARDLRLGRVVAVKVMHEGLGDDADFARKFDREARAAARLSDPHVVSVFDQGRDQGRPYIVMEFVEGGTLRHLITREAPFSAARALELIEPIAAALAAAHESGLVHRDVKPENVLIDKKGRLKVADFGLARPVTSQTVTVAQGQVIGTVSYLPPELVTNGHADARSDIYSTGVMLYELLTGEKPYRGDTPIQVAYAHANQAVPAPSTTLRHNGHAPLPDYVDALVISCTRRDSTQRPHDGRDLLRRVRRARIALAHGITNDEALCAIMHPASFRPAISLSTAASQPQISLGAPSLATSQLRTDVTQSQPSQSVMTLAKPAEYAGEAETAEPSLSASIAAPGTARSTSDPVRPTPRHWRNTGSPVHPQTPISPIDRRPGSPHNFAHSSRFPTIVNDKVHRRRRSFVAIVLVLLVALGLGFTSWWATSGRYVSVPNLAGMDQNHATAAARQANLLVTFDKQFSDNVPSGQVIDTTPAAGTRIEQKKQLKATISEGPQTYQMPTITGMDKNSALTALTDAHLTVGQITEVFDEGHAAGTVVTTSADSGTQVAHNTPIDLTVSKGPPSVPITDFTGKPINDARSSLTAIGFNVTSQNQSSDTVPSGQVISQTPAQGDAVKGSAVTLVVSTGPSLITIPDVRTQNTDAAHQTLQSAGFTVQDIMVIPDAPMRLNRVQRMDPGQGGQAARGSTITLYII